MSFGKAIELFLVNGTADSIITAELSNWNGMAIKIPRIEVASCKRDDITGPGVYFLFCKEDDGDDSVYIGEAENIKDRLIQHIRDNQSGKEKYYWNSAVLFTGRDLNKALMLFRTESTARIAETFTAGRSGSSKENAFRYGAASAGWRSGKLMSTVRPGPFMKRICTRRS